MKYNKMPVYAILESLIKSAGVDIVYQEVPDDHIDGAIWARSDTEGFGAIMMPDSAAEFPSEEQACLTLGHEMGHILSGLNSPDDPELRTHNEAVCDLIGVYLWRLALRIYDNNLESRFSQSIPQEDFSGIPTEPVKF